EAAVDAEELVGFGAFAQGGDAAVGMGEGEVALLREHDVEVEFAGEAFVELDGLVVERDALGGAVVGADDGGVASAGAAAEVALVEDGDAGDAAFGEVVGDGEAVDAGADDDDVVGGLEIVTAPHPLVRHGTNHRDTEDTERRTTESLENQALDA